MQPGRANGQGNPQDRQPQRPQQPRQLPPPPGFSGMQSNMPPAPPARGQAMPVQPAMPLPTRPAAIPAPATPAVAASLGRVSGHPMQQAPSSRPNQPAGGTPQMPQDPANAAVGPRQPTLTQQMRSIQPPDVARQAMSELGVLARELATLPGELTAAGLSRTSAPSYFEATQIYLGLARQAWESVAEERLEQSGAEPEYR